MSPFTLFLTLPRFLPCLLYAQLERNQAAESTSRKVVKEPAGSPAAPPQLSDQCKVLADVAEPPNMKRAFETTLSVALLESQLSALESKTGVAMVKRDQSGHAQALTLTGWTAIAGVAAMVVLVLVGGAYAYKRYTGAPLDSTTVVLKRSRYNRVAGVES
jgi:Golgi apparatus protein 1